MVVLSDDEVGDALGGLPGWELDGERIAKQYAFDDFRQAVAAIVRIAFEAEAANHHPDVDLRYNKLRIALSTHSEGGITRKDIELARTIESLSGR